MIVVNFSHPLTEEQRGQIEDLAGHAIERVIDVPTQLDDEQPFVPQVAALIARAGLTSEEWQTLPLLVSLPSYSPIVAVLLAYLHGLIGHFPTVVRLQPAIADGPTKYAIAELVSLDQVRANARLAR